MIKAREDDHEKTVALLNGVLGVLPSSRIGSDGRASSSFNVGLQIDALKDGPSKTFGDSVFESKRFLVHVAAWLDEPDEPDEPDESDEPDDSAKVARATKFLASLACHSALVVLRGSRAAKLDDSSEFWKRSDVHEMSTTDTVEKGTALQTVMAFTLALRVRADRDDRSDRASTKGAKIAFGLLSGEGNVPTNRLYVSSPAEEVLRRTLQEMLPSLGQLRWRFAGRESLSVRYANTARNRVWLRNDGEWSVVRASSVIDYNMKEQQQEAEEETGGMEVDAPDGGGGGGGAVLGELPVPVLPVEEEVFGD